MCWRCDKVAHDIVTNVCRKVAYWCSESMTVASYDSLRRALTSQGTLAPILKIFEACLRELWDDDNEGLVQWTSKGSAWEVHFDCLLASLRDIDLLDRIFPMVLSPGLLSGHAEDSLQREKKMWIGRRGVSLQNYLEECVRPLGTVFLRENRTCITWPRNININLAKNDVDESCRVEAWTTFSKSELWLDLREMWRTSPPFLVAMTIDLKSGESATLHYMM